LSLIALGFPGCAKTRKLEHVAQPVAPIKPATNPASEERPKMSATAWRALFSGDTLIGFQPGTHDSTRRYLGRLWEGYTADTMEIMLLGDNRPAYYTARLKLDFMKVQRMFSLNPLNIVRGLAAIPVVLAKGLYPDLALIRDIPAMARKQPQWGYEEEVNRAMEMKIDSLKASGRRVTCIINTGDLVKDGRYANEWERFLTLVRPLSSRVPYFAVAGNHERTDTEIGIANWRTATGLPVSGDRLYYCFDSADGWVRFIALDSNPMTDPANHWARDIEVKYSDEQIDWMVARVKEHRGPAFVFMHHPPFSSGFHRVEWQNDAVLRERRERMVDALHKGGIGIIASGHEHAYERALLTWPDGVLINIVTGGGGSPLHDIPPPAESARLFSEYKVAGAVIKPANVFTEEAYHFIHVRLWFGGGEFFAYAVQPDSRVRLMDQVTFDLKRYGVPKVDQNKMPVPEVAKTQPPPTEESKEKASKSPAKSDSVSATERLKSKPPPGRKRTR
jgi:3',5'-cyclic AMP phosphodiesterase CpdA